VSQPLFFSRLAQLLTEMGDQDPKLGEFTRAIAPVFVVGDGRELVPPLSSPRSFMGGTITGGGTGATHPSLSILANAPGGVACHLDVQVSGTVGNGLVWRMNTTPIAQTSTVSPLVFVEVDPGARSVLTLGRMNVASWGSDTPQQSLLASEIMTIDFIVPNGVTFQMLAFVSSATLTCKLDVKDLFGPSTL